MIVDESSFGEKAKFKILSMKPAQASGGTIDNCGLFDNIRINQWNTRNVFYWEKEYNFIELEIYSKCNIYRSGTSGWSQACLPLRILKYINDSYQDITSTITQNLSQINESQWELYINNLPAGRYKFIGSPSGTYRVDSEWYIEALTYNLIKKDGKRYGIYNNRLTLLEDINTDIAKEYNISDLNTILNIDDIFDFSVLRLQK